MNKEFANIPFCAEIIKLLFPRLKGKLSCVLQQPFQHFNEFLSVDYNTFISLKNAGPAKWDAFRKVVEFLSSNEGQDTVVDVYNSCIAIHEFPENLSVDEEEYSLEKKIDIAIKQYIAGVEAIAKYKGSISRDLEWLKMLFINRNTKEEIAEKLKLTTERVRQVNVELVEKIYNSEIKSAENLKFSPVFKEKIEELISHIPTICSHKTLCEALQCNNYEKTVASVFLPLKSAPMDNRTLTETGYSTFDQLYYISKEDSILWARTYIKALCGVLGYNSDIFDVRPLDIDEIMSLLEQNDTEFVFDKDIVLEILEQHTWVEQLILDDKVKYQLKYEKLKGYQQVARIAYENRPSKLNIKDIDTINRGKLNDNQARSIINNINNAKTKISWLVYGGKNGWIEYNESGETRLNVKRAVEQWIANKQMFYIKELLSDLERMGYTNLNELTIRSYVTDNCAVDNNEHDCFCNWEYIQDYKDGHSWRKKSQQGLVNWAIRMVHGYLMNTPEYSLPISAVNHRLKEDASKTDEGYEMSRSVEAYLLRYAEGKEGIFNIKDKVVRLTERGRKLEDEELKKIAVRSRRPGYYDVVVSKIMALLSGSGNGEIRLNDLQKECSEDIGDNAITAFYRIVDQYLPKQVIKIYKEGKPYLKLEKEKIEYAKPMVIIPVEDDKTQVENLVVVEDKHERHIREAGKPIVVDWEDLRENIILNLSFFAKQWELAFSFEESVDKFIRFIKQLDIHKNNRLAVQLPRNLVQLWNYQNDIYSYMGYMTNIVICYERLLREIHFDNTGYILNVSGLGDTINNIADICAWKNQYSTDVYHKSLRKIKYERNKIAHGEEFSHNLTEIILNTSHYIALYIYTVARFWHEKKD
ncbi:MAG: hypothetical protein IKL54_08400 [Bacteroidaceae bacterium]|nr:hypothetical protein [Bacteroidaceae bacterium]